MQLRQFEGKFCSKLAYERLYGDSIGRTRLRLQELQEIDFEA